MLHTRTFRCMTTDIELLLCCDDVAAAGAALSTTEEFFRSVENRFSRFIPDSELMQLNRTGRAGEPVSVSDDLAELVQMALAAARRRPRAYSIPQSSMRSRRLGTIAASI